MRLEGVISSYEVLRRIGGTTTYATYLCVSEATKHDCVLQIANELSGNGGLERGAYLLRRMAHLAEKHDVGREKTLGFDLLFPTVVESFRSSSQGGRQVNILGFVNIGSPLELAPMSNIVSRDHKRVDLRTSVWMMGRMLKLLGIAHSDGIAVRNMGGDNCLIVPGSHRLIVFDWSQSVVHQAEVPESVRAMDIASAAMSVIYVLGGNLNTGEIPDVDDAGRQYAEMLWRLACKEVSNTPMAHAEFYKLVHGLWGSKFHEFTTHPR